MLCRSEQLDAHPGGGAPNLDRSGNSSIGGGSAAMYTPGQVLKSGRGDPATARAVIIDMTQESPAWREVAPMAFPRRRHNLTLLPDGKVLLTGGRG
jgi:hypothetical protein